MSNQNFTGMEKISLVDYEGYMVCTLFTSGCNFRCPFCHNAPLVFNQIDEEINFDDIITYLNKRKGLIEGVCITGGEPTLMPTLIDKIRILKTLDLKIKLDTNGSNPQIIKQLIDENLIDYIAMDIKNGITNYHNTIGYSQYDLTNISTSIKLLLQEKIPYEFRTTLVDEFHKPSDIKEIASLLKGAKTLYLQHFVERETCITKGLHEVPKEKALKYQSILQKQIKNVILRGY